MDYTRDQAKAFAFKNMRGIWAAALNPFKSDSSFDEEGFRKNINHWINDLEIDGLFICGKQGEFFSMSIEERKKNFSIAVSEAQGRAKTIMSCSDQNFDNVIELAKYAQNIGADFIVVHAPVLNFITDRKEILYNYYEKLSKELEIGIAMWSHPDSGYLMEPELCAKIAELPNIVAIKYSVPREMYIHLTNIAGDKILVSTASEDDWLNNIIESTQFKNFQSKEVDEGFDEASEHSKFFRKGLMGEWKKNLSKSQIDRINKSFENVMKKIGYL